MRGLPPLPSDFVTLTAQWAINDGRCTTSWHLFNPGSATATPADLEALISQWFFTCLPDLLSVLGTDCSCSACRATTVGAAPLSHTELLAPNVGATGTTNPLNGNLCLTWRTNDVGTGGRSHTLLPLSDTLVDSDHATLRQISYAQAQSAAISYVQHLNALVSVDGALCVFAVIHRSERGRPLASSTWSPVLVGDASTRIGTIQRRTRHPRGLSPL